MENNILKNKVEKHLKKVDGGWWNILDRYNDGSVLIEWGKGDKTYKKIIK